VGAAFKQANDAGMAVFIRTFLRALEAQGLSITETPIVQLELVKPNGEKL
jgi:hypothetical protein